jgi:4-hydroxy-3-polyprenylbenzoate decarboxylase
VSGFASGSWWCFYGGQWWNSNPILPIFWSPGSEFANTDPRRDSIFTKGPSDVLDHTTSEIAIGSKLGIDATKKITGESFKREWSPLIKMDEAVKAKVEKLFGGAM